MEHLAKYWSKISTQKNASQKNQRIQKQKKLSLNKEVERWAGRKDREGIVETLVSLPGFTTDS